jgi:hypothetical protein
MYSEIENLIIHWNNDGTKTAGELTRQIFDLLKRNLNESLLISLQVPEKTNDVSIEVKEKKYEIRIICYNIMDRKDEIICLSTRRFTIPEKEEDNLDVIDLEESNKKKLIKEYKKMINEYNRAASTRVNFRMFIDDELVYFTKPKKISCYCG